MLSNLIRFRLESVINVNSSKYFPIVKLRNDLSKIKKSGMKTGLFLWWGLMDSSEGVPLGEPMTLPTLMECSKPSYTLIKV